MKVNLIQDRSFQFALKIINFCLYLEKEYSLKSVIAKQLIRSATSIGANAEEAKAAFSKADFTYKLSISHKESREALYWLKLINEANLTPDYPVEELINNAEELVRILTSTMKKLTSNL